MATPQVPALLHKMSVSSQKAWYKKNNMELPAHLKPVSAAQAKKADKPTGTKELERKSLQAYGATKGTKVGEVGGEKAAGDRDTIKPLSPEQHAKVQAAIKAAKGTATTKRAPIKSKEDRLSFIKAAVAKAKSPKRAERFDVATLDNNDEHNDIRHDHDLMHSVGIRSSYNEEVEQVNEMDKSQPAAGRDSDTPFLEPKPIKLTDKQSAESKLIAKQLIKLAKAKLKNEEVEQIDERNVENKKKKDQYVRLQGLKAMKAGKVDPARGHSPTRFGREELKNEEVELEESMTDSWKNVQSMPKGSVTGGKEEIKQRHAYLTAVYNHHKKYGNDTSKVRKEIESLNRSRVANEEVEQIDERKKVTHEDPLVTVHDEHGLRTHANLSTANRIFNTKVKHTDVHAGPVKASSESGKDLTFALSKHHEKEVVKEAKQIDEISHATLGKYIEKADKSADDLAAQGKYRQSNDRRLNVIRAQTRQIDQRIAGIKKSMSEEKTETSAGGQEMSLAQKLAQKAMKLKKEIPGADVPADKQIAQQMGEEVVKEDDAKEYDYEGEMAKTQLKGILKHAQNLHDSLEDDTNLPEWVQSKITLAHDYIQTASDYMDAQDDEGEDLDEALDPVGKEDKDVDNDGKVDSTDKYLLKRRAAIRAAINKKLGK